MSADLALRLGIELHEHTPACMGYPNGCVCERCGDRSARARQLRSEGAQNASSEAKRQSEAYFRRPWLHRAPECGGPPQPLRTRLT